MVTLKAEGLKRRRIGKGKKGRQGEGEPGKKKTHAGSEIHFSTAQTYQRQGSKTTTCGAQTTSGRQKTTVKDIKPQNPIQENGI